MLVCLSSVRGAPGVSSWSLLLAAAWPSTADRVIVEADGSGGVLGARYDLALEPGLADLLSQVRRGTFVEGFQLAGVARLLRAASDAEEALWAVPAPLGSHDVLAGWQSLAHPAAAAMHGDRRLWIADCGRVWAGSPVEPLLATAPLTIVVSDDSIPSLLALPPRIAAIPGHVALLVVGRSKHTQTELADFTGADSVWRVPRFSSLAEHAGQLASATGGRARRSKVWRLALTVAHDLAATVEAADPTHAAPPSAAFPPPATVLSPGTLPPPGAFPPPTVAGRNAVPAPVPAPGPTDVGELVEP